MSQQTASSSSRAICAIKGTGDRALEALDHGKRKAAASSGRISAQALMEVQSTLMTATKRANTARSAPAFSRSEVGLAQRRSITEVAVAFEDQDGRVLDLRRRHKVVRPLVQPSFVAPVQLPLITCVGAYESYALCVRAPKPQRIAWLLLQPCFVHPFDCMAAGPAMPCAPFWDHKSSSWQASW